MRALFLVLLACLNVQAQSTDLSRQFISAKPRAATDGLKTPQDLATLTGRQYTGISSIKPAGNVVRIIHADGAASIRYSDLPEDRRAEFGYDAAAAASADQQAAADARAAHQAASAANAKAQAMEQRKAAACQRVKQMHLGSLSFRRESGESRRDMKLSARHELMKAGYTESAANRIIEGFVSSNANLNKAPPLDPAFTQPQGALRGVPSGFQKKQGVIGKK